MGAASNIAWTDSTFNPWWGCQRVSEGCQHCYAESFAKRTGHKVWGPEEPRRFFGDKHWAEPRQWNREAVLSGTRRRVFCASMADVFEDRRDLDAPRERLFALIMETPSLDWLLLTKRPQNVMRLVPEDWRHRFPSSVWMGTTAENQERADERIPVLLQIPAVVRFVSAEPLLGPLSIGRYLPDQEHREYLAQSIPAGLDLYDRQPFVSWVIVGGESGAGARPCALEWVQGVVDECRSAQVATFVKQLGAVVVSEQRTAPAEIMQAFKGWRAKPPLAPNGEYWAWRAGLQHPKGGDPAEWPESLRVREFPRST